MILIVRGHCSQVAMVLGAAEDSGLCCVSPERGEFTGRPERAVETSQLAAPAEDNWNHVYCIMIVLVTASGNKTAERSYLFFILLGAEILDSFLCTCFTVVELVQHRIDHAII